MSKPCWETATWQGQALSTLFDARLDHTWLLSAEPWATKRLYYHVIGSPWLCKESAVHDAAKAAFEMWSPHCGITFQRRTDPLQAHVRVVFGVVLPGEGGDVLPTQKPFGWTQPVPATETDEIDHVDVFLNRMTPFATKPSLNERELLDGYRDVQTTLAHEIGHVLGLTHDLTDPSALMYFRPPRLQRALAESDISRVRARYGVT